MQILGTSSKSTASLSLGVAPRNLYTCPAPRSLEAGRLGHTVGASAGSEGSSPPLPELVNLGDSAQDPLLSGSPSIHLRGGPQTPMTESHAHEHPRYLRHKSLLIESSDLKCLYNYTNGRTEDNEGKGPAQQYLARRWARGQKAWSSDPSANGCCSASGSLLSGSSSQGELRRQSAWPFSSLITLGNYIISPCLPSQADSRLHETAPSPVLSP